MFRRVGTGILIIFFSIFSTGVLSYISMATPIGPWIESTLVLCVMMLFRLLGMVNYYVFSQQQRLAQRSKTIALIVAASSVGGIMATAMGFSLPTLYFLDKQLFCHWLASPVLFVSIVGGLALAGGLFGFFVAEVFEQRFLVKDRLPFPIGQLAYRMILAQHHAQKAHYLACGLALAFALCLLQAAGYLPKFVPLLPAVSFSFFFPATVAAFIPASLLAMTIPALGLELVPMYWAIGFVAGPVIALPLVVGALAKIFFVTPVHEVWFAEMQTIEFMLAFCSGIMLVGTSYGLFKMRKGLWQFLTDSIAGRRPLFEQGSNLWPQCPLLSMKLYLGLAAFIFGTLFFFWFSFQATLVLYVFCGAFICAYQVVAIAGRIGLAQLGRFATFVMLPAMLLFSTNAVQLTFIAAFVELTGGVATDILFGRKIAELAHIEQRTIRLCQLLGLIAAAMVIGLMFWGLIHRFGLGSSELFAQRGQTRAMLINVSTFDPFVLLLGVIFAVATLLLHINPMLMLSGLLMPINLSFGLIIGGGLFFLLGNREQWYPFWSGVFAAHSIWMVIASFFS